MGASESTGRSNRTKKEEEDRQQESSGISTEDAMVMAAGVVAAGVAAWGVYSMLSDKKDEVKTIKAHGMEPSLPDHQPRIRFSSPPDRFRINTDGESSGYGRRIVLKDRGFMVYEGKKQRNKRSRWSPPPFGRFKMNTDGACRPNPGGLGGYGGILRNHYGECVVGFHGFIGVSDGLTAEFHGIRKGLQLLDELGYEGSILETDCQAAFQWIHVIPENEPSNSQIICDCREIISECKDLIKVNHIEFLEIEGKDANKCADKLAAMALKRREEYVEFKDVPDPMKIFVDKDKRSHGLQVLASV